MAGQNDTLSSPLPPGSDKPGPSPPRDRPERAGDAIGPYKLLSVLGEGGFGVVWLAERREPMVQRVALKVIKPGMDSKAVLARFEQERQALAVMDHPNVARVYDAGTTPTGRPYFVMEHVQGEPLTRYCDRQRLTLRQRLELFVPVCEAVQHAHTKGIIHRDLKPSNVLVTIKDDKPVPKVIDFGVAKAVSHTLTEQTIYTEQGQLIGTPEYMSPEQAEMGATDIDTRTDVYSLGVVLYELLTGLLPFDPKTLRQRGFAEIQRIIREEDPPAPSTRLSRLSTRPSSLSIPSTPSPPAPAGVSTIGMDEAPASGPATAAGPSTAEIARCRQAALEAIARELKRELEWIPLKAMRKDRTQRYSTAKDLADDVRNYLAGLPAGPEAATYRLRKLLRRYRGPAAAAAAVLLVLSAGIAGTTYAYLRAEEQRAIADAERVKAVAAQKAEAHQRDAAEYGSYIANLQAADASLSANEPARVRARLDACPERLRGWEWRWLNARSDSSLMILGGQNGPIYSAEVSLDGTRVLTASETGPPRVWMTATGKELLVLRGHSVAANSARFSLDGTRIVTASGDATARVWDAATGKELAVLRGHQKFIGSARFSPDGSRIVTASGDKTARVWHAATGKELLVLRGHEHEVHSGVFSPDGMRVVTASWDTTARIWDAASGRELVVLLGHESLLVSAVFSPDGKRGLTASIDKTIRVWDADSGKQLAVLRGHEAGALSATFSPDGSRVLSASADKTARLWDTTNGKEKVVFRGHGGGVTSATFGAGGTRVVTTAADCTARVWDAATGQEKLVLRGHTGGVVSAQFTPDSAAIFTASGDGTVRVWDVGDGSEPRVLRGHAGWVESAVFSPDGTRVVSAADDWTARVWDAVSGRELAVLRGHEGGVESAAFSPDCTRIVTVSSDKTGRVWNAVSGRELAVLRGHEGKVLSGAFSPEGSRIVTASADRTARVWDAPSGRELGVLPRHESTVR